MKDHPAQVPQAMLKMEACVRRLEVRQWSIEKESQMMAANVVQPLLMAFD